MSSSGSNSCGTTANQSQLTKVKLPTKRRVMPQMVFQSRDDDMIPEKPKKRRIYRIIRGFRQFFSSLESTMDSSYDECVKSSRGPQGSIKIPEKERVPVIDGKVTFYGDGEKNTKHLGLYLQFRDCEMVEVQRFDIKNEPKMTYTELFFVEDRDYKEYQAWQSEYLKKFSPGTEALLYPPPSDGYYPHCVELTTPSGYIDNSVISPFWIWCLSNCQGEVRIMDHYFFFQDEEDATLFKLKL